MISNKARPLKSKHSPGAPMTLGNMRGLAKRIAPDRAKRAGVGGYSERTFLVNKKFLTGPASNLHMPNDSVALCLKQTFCDGYHREFDARGKRRSIKHRYVLQVPYRKDFWLQKKGPRSSKEGRGRGPKIQVTLSTSKRRQGFAQIEIDRTI